MNEANTSDISALRHESNVTFVARLLDENSEHGGFSAHEASVGRTDRRCHQLLADYHPGLFASFHLYHLGSR